LFRFSKIASELAKIVQKPESVLKMPQCHCGTLFQNPTSGQIQLSILTMNHFRIEPLPDNPSVRYCDQAVSCRLAGPGWGNTIKKAKQQAFRVCLSQETPTIADRGSIFILG